MGLNRSKELDIRRWNKIEDNLYLGDMRPALNTALLNELNISLVLSVLSKPIEKKYKDYSIGYKYICVKDHKSYDLLTHFPDCNKYISNRQKKEENVYVHYKAGVSRSATIVIAFLMQKYKLSYLYATNIVKQKRSFIHPNKGFVKQLKLYEEMKWTLDANNRKFRTYLFEKTMIRNKCNFIEDIDSYLKKLSIAEKLTKYLHYGQAFGCVECGFVLFYELNLIQNYIRQYAKRLKGKECEYVLIEPQKWMNGLDLELRTGVIECPKCYEVIGRYELPFKIPVSCDCPLHAGLTHKGFQILKEKLIISEKYYYSE